MEELPCRPDEWAESVFPEWKQVGPEKYAARNAHLFFSFSFYNYQYPNKKLEAWVHRLGQLLNDPAQVERLRQQLLSAEERERIAWDTEK
ncbi:hypothetical protein V3W47_18055 [Deinococcus sp. YIM 134068]|uniref:hypothetical protein n=1 Tax=Deinococcus lichenicola TaxID=3118910 RepID=UPI002F92A5E7